MTGCPARSVIAQSGSEGFYDTVCDLPVPLWLPVVGKVSLRAS
jgi:hypothetical protein